MASSGSVGSRDAAKNTHGRQWGDISPTTTDRRPDGLESGPNIIMIRRLVLQLPLDTRAGPSSARVISSQFWTN